MDPFLLITSIMAVTSLILMMRNTYQSVALPIYKPYILKEHEREIKIKLNNSEYNGFLLIAEELPKTSKDLDKRVIRALKASNVSATIINGIYLVKKDKLLKDLDERIKKLELMYESTKFLRYKKRLEILKEIYSKIMDFYKPYVGSFALIAWSEDKSRVKALKSILEIELGMPLKEININNLSNLLAPPARLIYDPNRTPLLITQDQVGLSKGIAIGKEVETDDLVILRWPQDFEKHVGIIGPTGRGKTVLTAGITTQLSTFMLNEGDPKAITVIDPKGDLTSLVKDIADDIHEMRCLPKIETSSELTKYLLDIISYNQNKACGLIEVNDKGLHIFDLSRMDDGIKDRGIIAILLLLIEKHLEIKPNGRRVVLIDEAWRLKDKGFKILETIIREGRSRLLHMIYVIHDIADIDSIILNNTSTLVLFGGSNEEYIERAERAGFLNVKENLLELMTGEALIRTENSELHPVKIFNFEELLSKKLKEI